MDSRMDTFGLGNNAGSAVIPSFTTTDQQYLYSHYAYDCIWGSTKPARRLIPSRLGDNAGGRATVFIGRVQHQIPIIVGGDAFNLRAQLVHVYVLVMWQWDNPS